MAVWGLQSLNAIAFGGLLFMLSAGFSLAFGLMRIPNLAHGSFFMLGAYVGFAALVAGLPFAVAVIAGGGATAALGGLMERFVLRPLAGDENSQILASIGISFIVADAALVLWGGDPHHLPAPDILRGALRFGDLVFPAYRAAVVVFALLLAIALWLALDKTRIGAQLRAGVDDRQMARGVGIRVSRLQTLVFSLGAALAGVGGVVGGPILSAYPGLDQDMLPLALIVVILGGVGSLPGSLVASMIIGAIYTLGQTLLPDLANVILFVPMVAVLVLRPRGLFGRSAA